MLKKAGFILGGLLLVGGLVALWRNETVPPDVQPKPSVAVEPELEPVAVGDPGKSESSGVTATEIAARITRSTAVTEPKNVDNAQLRLVIREILTGDNYNDRLRTIKNDMPAQLDEEEYRALEAYLLTPQDGKDGDFRQHEYALRNYMMDALRGEKDRLGETINAFTDVYQNPEQGEVMRNYALQHLSSVYIDNVSGLSTTDKSQIIAVFTKALDDHSAESLAGTALIGLQDASRWDAKTVAPSSVGNAAMTFLRDENSGDLSKISAFQVSGELKLNSAGPYAREVAFDSNADWMLRMSAVYALGQLGKTTGLETLLTDPNKHISRAVRMALNIKR